MHQDLYLVQGYFGTQVRAAGIKPLTLKSVDDLLHLLSYRHPKMMIWMRNWVISIVSGEARAIFLYFLFNHKEKLKVDLICGNVPGTQGYAYTKE